MKPVLALVAAAIALALLTACGGGSDAGKEACTTYQKALADSPETITNSLVLDEVKGDLSDMDAPTRRAFSDLITAADANIFTEPDTTEEAAAKVRSVCLSEHSVEIAH